MYRFFLLVLLTPLLVCACGGSTLPSIPEGEQTVTGILKPAELSAVRRGSHIIEQDGTDAYYAESSLVNLREYQDKRVTLRGQFEHNTDPDDLPVLVVDTLVDVEESVVEHVLSTLHVRLSAPVHWKLTEREGKYQFRTEGESEDPLLVLWEEEAQDLPSGGVPIVVDATRATKLTDELSHTQLVAVKRDETVLTLRFSPGKRLSADRLQHDFDTLLKSIELIDDSGDPSPSIGTGALSTPCGGVAGILCPTGYFCDIQDFDENIGRCRKL